LRDAAGCRGMGSKAGISVCRGLRSRKKNHRRRVSYVRNYYCAEALHCLVSGWMQKPGKAQAKLRTVYPGQASGNLRATSVCPVQWGVSGVASCRSPLEATRHVPVDAHATNQQCEVRVGLEVRFKSRSILSVYIVYVHSHQPLLDAGGLHPLKTPLVGLVDFGNFVAILAQLRHQLVRIQLAVAAARLDDLGLLLEAEVLPRV
jgi:hypothetical protein